MSEHVERLREFVRRWDEDAIAIPLTRDHISAILADYDTAVRERDEARRLLRDAVKCAESASRYLSCRMHENWVVAAVDCDDGSEFDLDAARALIGTP